MAPRSTDRTLAAAYGDPSQGIGLAARVILHLSHVVPLGPNDVAHLDCTQTGMARALAVRQGSLVKVLQRLLAGNVVAVERRFVADADRHMKVYRLTPLGMTTARNVRRHTLEPPRPITPSGWVAPRPVSDY